MLLEWSKIIHQVHNKIDCSTCGDGTWNHGLGWSGGMISDSIIIQQRLLISTIFAMRKQCMKKQMRENISDCKITIYCGSWHVTTYIWVNSDSGYGLTTQAISQGPMSSLRKIYVFNYAEFGIRSNIWRRKFRWQGCDNYPSYWKKLTSQRIDHTNVPSWPVKAYFSHDITYIYIHIIHIYMYFTGQTYLFRDFTVPTVAVFGLISNQLWLH